MKTLGVADTHTAIWYLFDDPRLSTRAGRFIDLAASNGENIAISAISLVEIVYLIDKKRLPATAYTDLRNALADPNHVFSEVALTSAVTDAMREVPREAIPDMPDRIVAATAVYLRVPVLSRDGRIRASTVETFW